MARVRLGSYELKKKGISRFDLRDPCHLAVALTWPQFLAALLASLRQFEHFGAPKCLGLLEPTPEGRHYNEFGAGGPAVIWGVVGRAAPVSICSVTG